MTDEIEIAPLSAPLHARIRPPGSKSLTNRALVCAALASGRSTLRGALASEDTEVMINALAALGVRLTVDPPREQIHVDGCGGLVPSRGGDLYVANSGTTIRFLTALVTLGNGVFRLDGTPRMRERPIQDLLVALGALGVNARSEAENGCPPVVVHAAGLRGGTTAVRGEVSSQFLSGLLLAAPYAKEPVSLRVAGRLVSRPYVQMTLAVMDAFGVRVAGDDLKRLDVPTAHYHGCVYRIEPDASAASYFFAAAAIAGGDVTVEGLSSDSLQGDIGFCDCLKRMGCQVAHGPNSTTVSAGRLTGIDVDMNAISDTVQTMAAVALFADGATTIRGVAHIRHKETDRIGNLAAELRKFGAEVEEFPDGLRINPRSLRGARIETYNDHRMAMSMALVGLKVAGVVIRDPRCTDKTYPRFFSDLAGLRLAGS